MNEKKNDILIRKFLTENKQEIADNGFSRRVMKQLPSNGRKTWNHWSETATAVCVTLFIATGGLQAVWNGLSETLERIFQQDIVTLEPKSAVIIGVVLIGLITHKVSSLA